MAHSIATVRVLEAEAGLAVENAAYVAGHSLGEYSALCAAGTFDLATTAKLLRIRGDAMQAAGPVGEGGMAGILGLTMAQLEDVLSDLDGVCEIANDNCPGQIVISGSAEAVEGAMAKLKEAGAKRALPLPVSAPFHSSLMQPAADAMRDALAKADAKAPKTKVLANVTAKAVTDTAEIQELLVKQVTGRVRWTDSVNAMIADGVSEFVEIGTGKVLAGLVKKISRDVAVRSIGKSSDMTELSFK